MKPVCLAAAAMLLAIGCAREERRPDTTAATTTTAASANADRARAAATIANAIAARPLAADSILKANNHTRESFQRLMFDIAADSAMSAVYASVKNR